MAVLLVEEELFSLGHVDAGQFPPLARRSVQLAPSLARNRLPRLRPHICQSPSCSS